MSLQKLIRFAEAEEAYRQALRIDPNHAETLSNLGVLLKDMGRIREAERSYQQALLLDPDYFLVYSNLLFAQTYRCDANREESLATARLFGERVAAKAVPFTHKPHPNNIHRRLRIGLVSGDLRNHPVGFFLEGVVAALPPEKLELFAYATSCLEDLSTKKLKKIISNWHRVEGLSDAELAQLIRSDAIDILVDLSGHTAYNRLSVFAWKPAPIQVTWLGYCATTGVQAMDYVLVDSITLKPEQTIDFVEKPWYLPDCYLCFTPPDLPIPVSPLPALAQPFVTFGCFNNTAKINPNVIACWARILLAVPNSRLLLKNPALTDATVQRSLMEPFQRAGIAPERLILEGSRQQTRKQHLECHHRLDMALDPFPYPGVTTSVEALWMGVPVLTLQGGCVLSRQGETLLQAAGLPDWIARDVDDYVAKAVTFASDLPRLATVRAGLRQQVLRSPLFDAPRFANHLTQAWQEMWRIWSLSDSVSAPNRAERPPEGSIPHHPAILFKPHDQPVEREAIGAECAVPSPFRLHIGGYEVKDGWKILNIRPGQGVDYVGDCKDLSRFPDGCCDEIYASHVIEHLPYQRDLPTTLVEFHRVMKPGAMLRISVPDLDILCQLFLDKRMSDQTRLHVMRMMFGGQTDENDFHHVGLNFEILSRFLVRAGFKSMQRVEKFSIFNDASSFAPYFGIPISLNVETIKQGPADAPDS